MKNELFNELLASVEEAVAIKNGETKVASVSAVTVPDEKAICADAQPERDKLHK